MLQLLWEIDVAIRSVETWAGKQNGDKEKKRFCVLQEIFYLTCKVLVQSY